MLTFVHDRDVYTDGYKEGMAEGITEGKAQGISEGLLKGKLDQLVELVKDNVLKISDAAARANMTEEEFRKLI